MLDKSDTQKKKINNSESRGGAVKEEDLRLNNTAENEVSGGKKKPYCWDNVIIFAKILTNVWHLNIQLHVKLVYWEYSGIKRQ